MASSSASSATSVVHPTIASSLPSMNNHFKLTRDNYNYWKFHIFSYLQAHKLFGYVDGTIQCLAKLLADSTSGLLASNPAYQR